ncbi:MAG TPA: type II toxin-antitoxin system VapC family toxin [Candidatus Methylomirabilis sp.]|nr:type II toxin-antitoxin system VapC family toxin [Candidatus Methylomirabilis sp.]
MIVTDTNLVVYLYVHGQHTAAAEGVLRRDHVWAAPLLWRSELRNSLLGLVRRRVLDLDRAVAIASDAERLLGGSEYSVTSASVLPLALRSGCSAYDCEFVALALDLDVRLITVDRQVLRAFPGTAVPAEEFAA